MAYRQVQHELTYQTYLLTLESTSRVLDRLEDLVRHIIDNYDDFTEERRVYHQTLFLTVNAIILDALQEIRVKLSEQRNARPPPGPPAA